MHERCPRVAATRLLGVLALLVGVLAMHGLSMGHDPASMSAQLSSPATTEMSMPMALSISAPDVLSADTPGQGHLAHLGAACVAVLTGGLSLMLLLLALRRRGQTEQYDVPPPAGASRLRACAAPPPRPSVTTLCLSRT